MKTLAEAREAGDTRYMGKPCKKGGHSGERFVSNSTCVHCLAAASKTPERLEQLRQYQQQDKIRQYQKLYRTAYAQTDAYKAQKKVYAQNNRAKLTAKTRKYQTAKLRRTPAWLTTDDLWVLEHAYELAAARTNLFGFAWHVDHKIPLQGKLVSGLHVPTNVQVIPATDNQRKYNRFATT